MIVISIFLSTLSSCINKLGHKDYFNFFNQFKETSFIEVKKNGFVYQLQARPAEYLAVNELKTSNSISSQAIQSEVDRFDNGMNFCIRISSEINEDVLSKKMKNEGEYFERIAKLNTDFPYVVSGLINQDTVHCQFHHFERAYKLQPFIQVLFNLNTKGNKIPNKIIFEDVIFNNGEIIEFLNFNDYYTSLPKLNI